MSQPFRPALAWWARRILSAAVSLAALAAPAAAQPQLSGVSFYDVIPTAPYSATNVNYWSTTSNGPNYNYLLFIGPSLNALRSDPLAPLTLTSGLNTFSFAAQYAGSGPSGLSLFFGAAPGSAGLTGWNTQGSNGVVQAVGTGATIYNPFGSNMQAAGLVGTVGGYSLALTNFQVATSNTAYVTTGQILSTPQACSGPCNLVGTFQITVQGGQTTAPEPATIALLAGGLAGVGLVARRRRV